MQILCCPAAVKAELTAIYPLENSGKEQLCNDAKPEELPKISHENSAIDGRAIILLGISAPFCE